jgi:hypothetical protein
MQHPNEMDLVIINELRGCTTLENSQINFSKIIGHSHEALEFMNALWMLLVDNG